MDNDMLLLVGVIGCTVLIVNMIFLGIMFNTRRKMNLVKTWPSTMGTVQFSTIQWRRSGSSNSSSAFPVVQYSYQVNGQQYNGAKLAPGPEVGGSGANKVIAKYPAGAQVMVFYNPQNPSDAVLETKASAQWIMWLVLIIVDVMLCGMAALFTLKP